MGDKVLVKNMRNVDRKGGKMDTRWIGPYIIDSHIGKGRYKLLNEQSGQLLKKAINSSRLKKYLEKPNGQKTAQKKGNGKTPCASTKGKYTFHVKRKGLQQSFRMCLFIKLYTISILIDNFYICLSLR